MRIGTAEPHLRRGRVYRVCRVCRVCRAVCRAVCRVCRAVCRVCRAVCRVAGLQGVQGQGTLVSHPLASPFTPACTSPTP